MPGMATSNCPVRNLLDGWEALVIGSFAPSELAHISASRNAAQAIVMAREECAAANPPILQTMTVKHVGIVALAVLAAGAAAPAAADEVSKAPSGAPATPWATPWTKGGHGAVRLVAAATGAGAEKRLRFGLEFRMDPGWKVFWRTPGDAGLPPHVDWSGSRNVASVAIRWPRPVRFSEYGITSWGYRSHVILPLAVAPKRPGEAGVLTGDIRYQICKDICVLGEARLSLDLPKGPAKASPATAAIARYAARVPGPLAKSDLSTLDVRVIRLKDKTEFIVTAEGRRTLPRGLRAIVEAPPGIRVAVVAKMRTEFPMSVRLRYAARVRPPDRKLDGLPVTVTLLGDGIAVERKTRIEVVR